MGFRQADRGWNCRKCGAGRPRGCGHHCALPVRRRFAVRTCVLRSRHPRPHPAQRQGSVSAKAPVAVRRQILGWRRHPADRQGQYDAEAPARAGHELHPYTRSPAGTSEAASRTIDFLSACSCISACSPSRSSPGSKYRKLIFMSPDSIREISIRSFSSVLSRPACGAPFRGIAVDRRIVHGAVQKVSRNPGARRSACAVRARRFPGIRS